MFVTTVGAMCGMMHTRIALHVLLHVSYAYSLPVAVSAVIESVMLPLSSAHSGDEVVITAHIST